MTLTKFNRLYEMYKTVHDAEQNMLLSGRTYAASDYEPNITDIL